MLLAEKLHDRKLLLASHSPRRRELLAACGLDFTLAVDFEVEECYPETMPAVEVPAYLSRLKSQGYPHSLASEEILITADTVVICGDSILGKPVSRAHAMEMLRMLSGRTHTVITGVTLRSAERMHTFSASSEVSFRHITDEEIDYYLDAFRPFDKAGAYGIQEWIGFVAVEGVKGSFYNVMGLPVQSLYVNLEKFLDRS